ncbi:MULTISPECIES: RNA polymerase sigma factor [unclassified Oceanispirochaeta]|uniref:RNA polymerase sigma factor n=1 Tax=unclassified Oceanispirochaeta TaxID=2635722 RepID=UPI000E08FB4C|nr:RNA polymerase sigma factor [Oceanispirochaeta sp. M1]MBF9015901.1 RNA polymerase sigma factor [Oceanispirochaeta sp. M2]NPD72364.1 RNA polymerase sigma factor [Oceanispirochaeta sp. M1]RDG32135.1 RNA polymerase sigma factor [Oceanispirochaeta sp. M1]
MSKDFELAYKEFYPVLIRVAYRITGSQEVSEDLCQEAFVRYYERMDKIPPGDQAKYWMIRVVKNLAFNHEKRKGRERNAYQKHYHEPKAEIVNDGEKGLMEDESKKLVQNALMKLPYKMRVVLSLKEYANLNYKQIGEILKISEGNVKIRVFRARQKLSEILDKGDVYVP